MEKYEKRKLWIENQKKAKKTPKANKPKKVEPKVEEPKEETPKKE